LHDLRHFLLPVDGLEEAFQGLVGGRVALCDVHEGENVFHGVEGRGVGGLAEEYTNVPYFADSALFKEACVCMLYYCVGV